MVKRKGIYNESIWTLIIEDFYIHIVCVCVCESKTHWGIYRDYDIVYSNVKKYLKFEQNIKKLLLVGTIFYLDFILRVFQILQIFFIW